MENPGPPPAEIDSALDPELQDAVAWASSLVSDLGEQATARQRDVVEDSKPGASLTGSVVTQVDRDLEAQVDAALLERFPDDGLLGEEGADRPSATGRTWIVDPVDGTLNYARRLGPWSVVLSRWSGARCDLVTLWTQGSLYTAVAGHGAHLDGRTLQLPGPAEPGGIVKVPARLAPATGEAGWLVKIVDSSASEVAAVADGRFVGSIRPHGDRRDLHAPALLVAEAGGTVTDLDGGPWDGLSKGLIFSAPGAHAALLELWRTYRAAAA